MAETIRVLFVEDQPDDVELIRLRLEREALAVEGRTVTTASGLREALADFLPDVVLCDYTIPGFSGRQALQIVREQAPFIPFIFVSGTIGEDTAVECLREGATDYLLKGNLSRLAAAVRRAIAEAAERAHVREVEQARLRLAEILEATSDVVAISDPERNLIFINEAGCRLLDVTREEALRGPADAFYVPWARERVRNEAIPAALEHGTWQGETALLTHSGEEIPVSQVVVAHRGADGKARFFSSIARDIRERKAYEARLRYLANFDALTGLPNRSLLGDRVAQALVHARRTRRNHLAVVAIGLDGFKRINEAFGRPVGDRVLIEAAARLLASVREGDTAARIGADEFVVLLSDLARPDDAHPVARKFLDTLGLPQSAGGQELRITASAGAAIFPADGEDFETLASRAGAAMRRAKTIERGSFQYYSSDITDETLARLNIETGLRAALHNGELALHYQPQCDLQSGLLTGVEALMRWFGTDPRPIGPARFIPVAEETGLIRSLGEWALVEACASALAWTRAPSELTVAVNVSPIQLHHGGFPAVVARALRTSGLPAERLELEITESALMSDQAGALEAVAQLKALGVKIAIDDFGTGYSSLAYLSRLPIDCLKVDQGFIKRMIADSRDAAIVQSVISLGHGLGLTVLAEGVETAEQFAILKEMGCDQAQGFFLSAAVAGDKLQVLLDAPPSASLH